MIIPGVIAAALLPARFSAAGAVTVPKQIVGPKKYEADGAVVIPKQVVTGTGTLGASEPPTNTVAPVIEFAD